MNEWARVQMKHLEYFHKKNYKAWKREGHKDDRELYCDIYEQLEGAINVMSNNDNTFIRVAVQKQLKKEWKLMDEIKERFTA